MREGRTYEVVCDIGGNRLQSLEAMFQECGLQVKGHRLVKSCETVVYILDAYGSIDDHERLMEKLLADGEVKEFRY